MPVFVHIADLENSRIIQRSGVQISRNRPGVYAMPVTSNFFVTHQWLRELKRGVRRMVGVYFRIGDGQPVLFGHYGRNHLRVAGLALPDQAQRSVAAIGAAQ
jgi:hypothetical protein